MNAPHSPAFPATLDNLASRPLWVAWQTEDREPGKEPTKVPHSPQGGNARANDPATRGTRAAAEALAASLPRPYGLGGIGLELADLGNGFRLGGIDLDTCRDEAGELAPWAAEVVERIGSYTEVSPSGTGVKVFFTYAATDLPIFRAAMGTDHGKTWKNGQGKHPPAIELHIGNRYFAVTDEHLAGTPAELVTAPAEVVLWVIREAGPRFAGTAKTGASGPESGAEARGDIAARIEAKAARFPLLARRWEGDWDGLNDQTGSGRAFALGAALKLAGFDKADIAEALHLHSDTREWAEAAGPRDFDRIFDRAGEGGSCSGTPDPELLADPDMGVLRLGRRSPPPLPLDLFGHRWATWMTGAAEAAAAPCDYVALPLLAAASALIGHARWAQATPGWVEPPHIWAGTVGDSGSSKSPGADCLLRDVLPTIESRMMGDFPDRLRDFRAVAEAHKAGQEVWQDDVRKAKKANTPPPLPPAEAPPAEPQAPRLRQSDVTVERVATLLATAAPKGLLITRDELAGWLLGLNAYNDAGRAFWIEAYGGRPYRVERQKLPEPIIIPRLAVAVTGSTQPEKLAELFREADDGLLGRFVWGWPDPLPFRLGTVAPQAAWAIEALDRLRLLDLAPGEEPGAPSRPIMVELAPDAVVMMEAFAQDMQRQQEGAGGLMRSAYGKARGLALRLSLVLTMLRWCGEEGWTPSPDKIDGEAFAAACDLVAEYFMPMAERVYGDAAAKPVQRQAATLARWIVRTKAAEVHVRTMQRKIRLPGLGTAADIHAAAAELADAGWLLPPQPGGEYQAR